VEDRIALARLTEDGSPYPLIQPGNRASRLIFLFVLAGCSFTLPAAEAVALSGRAMGTTWAAKWVQPAAPLLPATVERHLAARLEQLERQFSTYRPDSALSRFNASPGTDWFPVPSDVALAAARARELSALTTGAFDVTVAPLLKLWGFGPFRGRETWPSETEIASARAVVGWRQLEVRLAPPALRKSAPAVAVDFSSFAKGFAVDALSDSLRALGATNHLVQIGGDMKASGPGQQGRGWRVAIEQPVGDSPAIARIVDLVDRTLSTSGNTRNFVTLGGRRVGHLIDPRSGLPAAGTLAAVSVIHISCATSSALATGLFVLGAADADVLAARENLAALFITQVGTAVTLRATPQFDAESTRSLAP
jgi:thiamine biosynthesis lipoprotein